MSKQSCISLIQTRGRVPRERIWGRSRDLRELRSIPDSSGIRFHGLLETGKSSLAEAHLPPGSLVVDFAEVSLAEGLDQLASTAPSCAIVLDHLHQRLNLEAGSELETTREQMDQLEAELARRGQTRRIVCSSVPLDLHLRDHGLVRQLDGFTQYRVEPWKPAVARQFLDHVAESNGLCLDERASRVAVEQIGCCIPMHIQLLCQHLLAHRGDDWTRRTEADVLHVLETELTRDDRAFAVLMARLRTKVGEPGWALAQALLAHAARGPLTAEDIARLTEHAGEDVLERRQLRGEVLSALRGAEVLCRDADQFRLFSPLFAAWLAQSGRALSVDRAR